MDHFREKGVGDHWSSLPEYFLKHGYVTLGSGKLFHPTVPPDNDYAKSWSQEWPYYSPECTPPRCPSSSARGPADGAYHCLFADPPNHPTVCVANTTADEHRFEYQLEDQRIRDSCIKQLEIAKGTGKNFFVGCGFHRPHVPWVFPAEFLSHFPEDIADIPLAKNTHAPIGMPKVAWHFPADVHGMNIKFNGTCNMSRSRLFRRAYYAAVAYTDYNIGMVLDTLERLGFSDNTAVLVFGDHGWQLGEHDTWAKMTNFELAVRTPTIIRAPWLKSSVGKVSSVLAETVDFYPTLVDLAGLPEPRSVGEEINGTSLLPVFHNPADTSIKRAAFSQFAKPSRKDPFLIWPTPARNKTEIMGYSVRVDEWRYTAWFGFDGPSVQVDRDVILGRELYAHHGDDGDLDFPGENINLVNDPANAEIVQHLHRMILEYIQIWPSTRQTQSDRVADVVV
eukprot:TRINITY_DN32549_c0_g1_i1.p1 TRINITY_DN32549_c0_g1~~TRINITY_DN32549_c0_g1_i1.p1  ORF type:complete len:450 (+),score=34.40 TRINITY_DN32549_c0_g1_i1:145-1494(+)